MINSDFEDIEPKARSITNVFSILDLVSSQFDSDDSYKTGISSTDLTKLSIMEHSRVNPNATIPQDESSSSDSLSSESDTALSQNVIPNPLFRVVTTSLPGEKSDDKPVEVEDPKVKPGNVKIEDHPSSSKSKKSWKDLFNLTAGNFKPQLKRKDLKGSFNTPKKGFTQEQESGNRDAEVGETSNPITGTSSAGDGNQRPKVRKLSIDNEQKESVTSPRNCPHSWGRGGSKGRGKSSKPRR